MVNETPWLLIPMRSFAQGKSRLADFLDAQERVALNTLLLDHMLAVADHWPGLDRTVVVSPCPEVLEASRRTGARVLRQPCLRGLNERSSETLNMALSIARRSVWDWGARDLIISSCDLPAVCSEDFRRLRDYGQGRGKSISAVLASNREGRGTNALYLPAAQGSSSFSFRQFPFCFGEESARRHAEAANRLGLPFTRVAIPGLAFDIDTPDDLVVWSQNDPTFS
ncbi:2-phospho-L-lactate guanylyltransferase [Paraburkholderia antibiotica]|uniref:2-phospho-L-lactate guanylyltransferase n=1 Tax=Paraburkholderia antibiotica TaxID=2728839 RepID=A0A7X9ZZE7_9BURK|nr:2-phospho-L-lactate guanylyltransferase [Paraburkholderia antibiotica]NML32875.1 2-phospho-L-lactate guanylyltransferase [Paraburkholderia antibiotica]